MPKISGIVGKIDNELKTISKPVYEFDNLSQSDLDEVKTFYSSSGVSVWGPCVDRVNSSGDETKYRIVIPNKNYRGIQNA